jgi:hypothetical protein
MKRPTLIQQLGDLTRVGRMASHSLRRGSNIRSTSMNKTPEPITEVVRDPKPPFRKIENQPRKAQRHRYERRKVKEYLHLADWLTEEPA